MNHNFRLIISGKTIFFICFFYLSSDSINAGPDNIADQAKTTASSSLNYLYGPHNAIDGNIRLVPLHLLIRENN